MYLCCCLLVVYSVLISKQRAVVNFSLLFQKKVSIEILARSFTEKATPLILFEL